MKFKVGDEVLVKVQIVGDSVFGYRLKTPDGVLFAAKKDGVVPVPDMTAEEAWEIARMMIMPVEEGGMPSEKYREIFGNVCWHKILKTNNPQEVKNKIEAWEAEKEIKVGDEVDVCGDKGVVTSFGTDGNSIHVLYLDGIVNSYRKGKDIKKTGRHIDIEGFLKEIGGNE